MDIETVWYNRLTNRKSMEVQNLKEFSDQGRIFIQWQQSSQRVLRIKPIFQIGSWKQEDSGWTGTSGFFTGNRNRASTGIGFQAGRLMEVNEGRGLRGRRRAAMGEVRCLDRLGSSWISSE
jgi:hypothetical protein